MEIIVENERSSVEKGRVERQEKERKRKREVRGSPSWRLPG